MQRERSQQPIHVEERKINMELTLTQNSALYFAQHKVSKRRAALFRRFRGAVKNQPPDMRQLTFGNAYVVQRRHQDNGR
jgi:hypothetical protein